MKATVMPCSATRARIDVCSKFECPCTRACRMLAVQALWSPAGVFECCSLSLQVSPRAHPVVAGQRAGLW